MKVSYILFLSWYVFKMKKSINANLQHNGTAISDHYALDGADSNGFVGCMWSICGIHDQGWAERAVFGKIRSVGSSTRGQFYETVSAKIYG
jgi:hypothetical protein